MASEFVLYRTKFEKVRARVIKRFKNGTVFAEPYFFVTSGGKDRAGFIGGRVYLRPSDLVTPRKTA